MMKKLLGYGVVGQALPRCNVGGGFFCPNWTKTKYGVYFRFVNREFNSSFGGISVANTQSAKKQVRNSYRKWLRNRYVKGKVRGALQMVNKAIAEGNADQALALMPNAASQLDKAAKKNVIHHKKAARLKSRLMHKINALQAQ